MINHKKTVVVLPAYIDAKTIGIPYREIDFNIVDEVLLVDNKSKDETIMKAQRLENKLIITHESKQGIWQRSEC